MQLNWKIYIIAAAFALAPVVTVQAEPTVETITVFSGDGGVGDRDPQTSFTRDGGITYEPAYIVAAHSAYDVIPGTKYVNIYPGINVPTYAWTMFRTTFNLPEGFFNPALDFQVHADNVAEIYVNGVLVGRQPFAEIFPNFRDPVDIFHTENAELFRAGENVIDIHVYNFSGPGAVDYLTDITYSYNPVIEVAIDIKPGSFPNSINPGSKGTVPVAVFGSETFDVTVADPNTITLAGAAVKLKKNGKPMASYEDVNDDGIMDLVVHVVTADLGLDADAETAELNGKTYDGTAIAGSDSVRLVP